MGLRWADFRRGDADSPLHADIHISTYFQYCHTITAQVSHIHSLFQCQNTLQIKKGGRVNVWGSSLTQIEKAPQHFLLIDKLDAA